MSVSLPDPNDDVPYAETEWNALLDALYGRPVDTPTLRNLLDGALITLSSIAAGQIDPSHAGDVRFAARRLRAIRKNLEQGKEAAV